MDHLNIKSLISLLILEASSTHQPPLTLDFLISRVAHLRGRGETRSDLASRVIELSPDLTSDPSRANVNAAFSYGTTKAPHRDSPSQQGLNSTPSIVDKSCKNCGKAETSRWRKRFNSWLCGPCEFYLRDRGQQRPSRLHNSGEHTSNASSVSEACRKTNSKEEKKACSNCSAYEGSAWRKRWNCSMCVRCEAYLRTTGRPRPLTLVTKSNDRRKRRADGSPFAISSPHSKQDTPKHNEMHGVNPPRRGRPGKVRSSFNTREVSLDDDLVMDFELPTSLSPAKSYPVQRQTAIRHFRDPAAVEFGEQVEMGGLELIAEELPQRPRLDWASIENAIQDLDAAGNTTTSPTAKFLTLVERIKRVGEEESMRIKMGLLLARR